MTIERLNKQMGKDDDFEPEIYDKTKDPDYDENDEGCMLLEYDLEDMFKNQFS